MDFTDAQRRQLRELRPVIKSMIGRALDRFYARAGSTSETASFFQDAGRKARAKAAQEAHWGNLAEGSFDERYYASIRRIGTTHARIGLEPRWYVGAYALVIEELLRGLGQACSPWKRVWNLFRSPSANDASVVLVKAALLDMEVSLSIYFEEAQTERSTAIARFEQALEALSAGDLTHELSGMPTSFAALERSFNDTLLQMRGMIGAVGHGSDRINTGIAEIARASEDLARRTQNSASSLEQTTAAVAQMDNRLKTTAQAAQRTVACADQAIATVGEGREVAEFAVQAMGRVSESAKGIDHVIEGLDKIAFQTRVLAMNAAVEAGRAGDAGRGFAVVADLVSALAMRAEEEAKRAREQLTATQGEVQTAVEAVQKVDGALTNISGDVGQVHELLASMARDNVAQSSAITQISVAIGTMDRDTQQNAAMVQQTSAAARTLTAEVAELSEQTSAFVIEGGQKRRGGFGGKLPAFRTLPAAAISALTAPGA
jgi:methyl-accepting chemotaxis protein